MSEKVNKVYAWFKKVGLQVFGGLFMEKKDNMWVVSMGKTAFWAVFVHCMYVWNLLTEAGARQDVSDGELYALFTLLGYAAVKVSATTVSGLVSSLKKPQQGASE